VSCGSELDAPGKRAAVTHRPPAVSELPADEAGWDLDESRSNVPAASKHEPLQLDFPSDSEIPEARPPGSEPTASAPASVSPRSAPPSSLAGRARAAAFVQVTGRLVVIVEDGSEGRQIELSGQQLDFGRREGDIVLPEDRYMSPRHARLFRQDGAWYLRDLNSTNGVYRRLRQAEVLQNDDLILLGLEVLQFQLVDHAERGLGHAMEHGTMVFGSPGVTRRARLCQRTIEGVTRDVYYLIAEETTVGREIGDIVFTSDPFMSRRHAAIRWQETTEDFVLSDLSSSNGTYLAIREDVRLRDGDFVRMGQHLFRVDLPQSARKTH
jgi:pSer/pThr/pTyr-binding forkhead associated (FHA) protein